MNLSNPSLSLSRSALRVRHPMFTRRSASIWFILFATVLTASSYAQTQDSTWKPSLPSSSSFVWIKLPSGEWLAGSVKSLRDDVFAFDSEELDNLTFDWDDIKELRSQRFLTFSFEDLGTVTGTAVKQDA